MASYRATTNRAAAAAVRTTVFATSKSNKERRDVPYVMKKHNRQLQHRYPHLFTTILWIFVTCCLLNRAAEAALATNFATMAKTAALKDSEVVSQKCNASVKSYTVKSRAAPYVFLAMRLKSVRTAADRTRYNSLGFYYSVFEVLEVIKAPSQLRPTQFLNSTHFLVQVPYDRSNSGYSRQHFCLTKSDLRKARALFIFLAYDHRNNSWRSVFLPSTIDSITKQGQSDNGSVSSSLEKFIMTETRIIPLYEITIDPSTSDERKPINVAEVNPGESLLLKCSVAPDSSLTNINWIKGGQPIEDDSSTSLISEESSSSYHFSSVSERHEGVYECRSSDSKTKRIHSAHLRLKLRKTPRSIALLEGQKECEGNFKTSYCQNGGQCFMHIETGKYGCFCQSMFYGNYCQHRATIGKPFPSLGPTTSQYNRTVGIMAICLALSFLIVTCVAIGLVHYTRYRKRQRKFTDVEINSLYDSSAKAARPALVIDAATPQLLDALSAKDMTCPNCGWSCSIATQQHFFPPDMPVSTAINKEDGSTLHVSLGPDAIPVTIIRKLSAPPGCPPVITVHGRDYDPRGQQCPEAFKRYSLQTGRPIPQTNSRERRLGVSEAHLDDLLAEPLPEDLRNDHIMLESYNGLEEATELQLKGYDGENNRSAKNFHNNESDSETAPLTAGYKLPLLESSC